eukprot:12137833-Karenia_brevis.AAC.1
MVPHAATAHPFLQAEMAALKLIMLGSTPMLCFSSSTGATRCHYPPFSQAEMAALKLITSSKKQWRHTLPLPTLLAS